MVMLQSIPFYEHYFDDEFIRKSACIDSFH
jgi:hypothetical protein